MHKKVMHIADYFKVSKLVIARKAFDQKYINQTQYNEIAQIVKNEFDKRNSRRGSGGNAINNARSRLDDNFMRILIESTEHGETTYTEAYKLEIGRASCRERV